MANVKIRPRRDTTANWNSYNPVLADGEMGFEIIGTGQPLKLKIGDGNTAWTGLTYAVDFPSIQSAASTASNAASAASTSSANAKTSETNAKASETNAASSASAASTSASNASSSASAASSSATNASSSASAAASSASAASSSASAADAAKTAAASSASAAATSEANAASSATAAANSAASLVVVNDLTTGGTTNALSAEQGKVLSTSISTLATDVDFPVTNLVTNGDFSNGTTGWVSAGSTISVLNNVLSCTGTGTLTYPMIASTGNVVAATSHKIYVAQKVMVTNSVCKSLYIALSGTSGGTDDSALIQLNPVANTWYAKSQIITSTNQTGNFKVRINHNYADTATANGKVMEIQYIVGVDLTAAFGAGNEPTAAQMDAMLAFYPNSWFDGTINFAANPKLLPYLLNNLRYLNTEKTSYGVYSGLGVTAQSTPDMTVAVASGTIYMENGARFTPAANTALAVTAADATNPRIDIVYVNSSGVIAYLAGTAAASPSAPSVPSGGQKLAEISVAANATTVVTANIADRRKGLWNEAKITPTLLNGWNTNGDATNVPKYWKDQLGYVHFEGRLANGTAGASAITLAGGYRIASGKLKSFYCPRRDGAGAVRLDVSSGNVVPVTNPGVDAWIDLSAIIYLAEA